MGVSPEPGGQEGGARRLRGRGRSWGWLWRMLGVVALLGAGLGLWYAFPLRSVTVSGNHVLSAGQVKVLAGLTPPFGPRGGWLYYGAWRAAGLKGSPWVRGARILRRAGGRVQIAVSERSPALLVRQPDGRVVVTDWDGTVLPDARLTPGLPLLSGWGPPRLAEARAAARLFAGYTVESVQYSPSGLTIRAAAGTVWSGDMVSLRKYSGSVRLFAGKRISIYPWGVSVQQ